MAGLFGVVHRDGPADATPLVDMGFALAQRGPDDAGTLLDGPCALGVRRGVERGGPGEQPASSEDRTVWAIVDGALAEPWELRRHLEARGHHLQGRGDAELVAHLHEAEGEALLERLRAPFALALWSRRERALLLARDPSGLRPLYLAETGEGVVFASSLRALLAHPWTARVVDETAVAHYLHTGRMPADRSVVRGVEKVAPGQVVRIEDGRVASRRRWWVAPGPDVAPSEVVASGARLAERLRAAVGRQLPDDGLVGLALSGGSHAAVVAAQVALLGRAAAAFTVALPDDDLVDLERARRTAAILGVSHEVLIARPDPRGFLEDLARHLDEPEAADEVAVAFLTARLAGGRVRVLLGGHGGRGLLAGGRAPQQLAAIDLATAAHGVELRAPLVDLDLADAVAGVAGARDERRSLPPHTLLGALGLDPAGRTLVEQLRPAPPARTRLPLRAWARGPLKVALREVLRDRRARERPWMEPGMEINGVHAPSEQYRRGGHDPIARPWALALLELWIRAAIEGEVRLGRTREARHA